MGKTLLKNGIIVDGTGKKRFLGDVLLVENKIAGVGEISVQESSCKVIDCKDKVIAPGFIDAHSHNDWFIASKDDVKFIMPFIRQGITTFIGGNCGYGVAGIKKGSPHKLDIRNGLFSPGIDQEIMPWDSWSEYFDFAENHGLLANLASLVGNGTCLLSVAGLNPPESGEYTDKQIDEALKLLEEGMDDGCIGVSFGLGYCPGKFLDLSYLRKVAKLVARKGKVFAIHGAVLANSALPGEEATNIKWLRSLLETLEDTGVRLEISHLIFPYRNTWTTFDDMLELIQKYIDRGMDLGFDIFPYKIGGSEIAIIMPKEMHSLIPEIYTNEVLQAEMAKSLSKNNKSFGRYFSDIQLTNPIVDDLQQYRGMFLDEMAKARGMTDFENVLDIYKKTRGAAGIYFHTHYCAGQVEKLMVHKNVLYQTDAWIQRDCIQNPSAFGSMPKFIRLARESKNLSLEEVITRMTGKTASRFNLESRGRLKDGYYADVVVFDPDIIRDTNDDEMNTDSYPIGIEHVFINGSHVIDGGIINDKIRAGHVIK